MKKKSLKPAVFLDRDGTLVTERAYLSDPRNIFFYPGVFEGLRLLQKAGFTLVVVTNQSGLARGYFSRRTFQAIQRRFTSLLKAQRIKLAGIYFCPHLPEAGCACRKPKPLLARRAARELGLVLRKSFVVGDQWRDLKLAKNIGARAVLVLTGGGRQVTSTHRRAAAKVSSRFKSAAAWIVAQKP